jgi:hypothetical protein
MITKKGFLAFDELIPWLIALGAAALMFFLYAILNGKLGGTGDFLRNLIRFG